MKTEKLETLSIEELYALADRTGLDLPPGLEMPFVIEEILEAIAEDSEDRKATQGEALHIGELKYSGFGDLDVDPVADDSIARRYNDTMIRAMVRDPSWAFAFWDVSDSDMASLRGEDSAAGLFLRVAELGKQGEVGTADAQHDYFDIPIADDDLQWYINLPRSGVRFRIDLCARRSGALGKLRVLARSNEVESPRQSLSQPPEGLDGSAYELLALSGADDLAFETIDDCDSGFMHRSGLARPADRAD